MAFTANQLISYSDMQVLVDTEDYYVKATFSPSNELVTKAVIIASLWLAGTDPLASYSTNQLVRYGDIAPLGTAWIGDEYICVDDNPDNPPTAPTIESGITPTWDAIDVDWGDNPGSDDNFILYYVIEMALYEIGYVFGNARSVSDLLHTRHYTYTGLISSQDYVFRVKAVDSAGQSSPWSNGLVISTASSSIPIPTLFGYQPYPDYVTTGKIQFGIWGPTTPDYLTVEVTITAAGTTDPSWDWHTLKDATGSNPLVSVEGSVDTSHPTTYQFVIYRAPGIDNTETFTATTFRTPTNFYGWCRGTIKLVNSSIGQTIDTAVHNWQAYGQDSGQ